MEQQLEIPSLPKQPRILLGGATLIRRLARRAEQLTGLESGELGKPNRTKRASLPRFAVMRVAVDNGRRTTVIGKFFGMDHSSIIHGARRASELESDDEDFAELLRLLRQEV